MFGRQELIAVTVGSAFVVGMILAILGSIKLPLAKRLAIGETQIGGLLAAMSVALIPMMLLSGILLDLWGPEWVLIAGSFLAAGALFALALCRTYWGALAALLLAGAAVACLSTGGSVLMPKAFFPDDKAAALLLGNVFFGLGALVTPALAELLIERIEFRKTLLLLALICLVPAAAAAITPAAAFQLELPQRGDLFEVLLQPVVWLTGLAFLFYMPLESTLAAWTTTLLTDLGFSPRAAAWGLSGFWLVFLGSRLGTAFLFYLASHPVVGAAARPLAEWYPWIILGLALTAAVVMGNLSGSTGQRTAIWGLLMLGVLFGPIFPTLVATLFSHKSIEGGQGTAYGAMFAIGAIGNLFLPPMIGAYARRHTVQRSLRIAMLVGLLLAAAALLLGLWLQFVR